MQSTGKPVLGLLVVALVVVAAVLLIAGLGVPVGAGVIIGVVLGLIAVGAAMALTLRDPSSGWSFSRMPTGEPGITTTFLQEHGLTSARVADVDAGALTRVLPVGDEAIAAGIRVELVVVELRTDGGIAALVTHTRPPIASPGHLAEAQVTDDVGTDYVAAAQSTGQTALSAARFELRFSPAPPPAAGSLTIQIHRFMDPFQGSPSAPAEGPWSFAIALDRPNSARR